MALLIAAVAFALTFIIAYSIGVVVTEDEHELERRRLLRYVSRVSERLEGVAPPSQKRRERFTAVTRVFSSILQSRNAAEWLMGELQAADIPMRPSEFAAFNALAAVGLGLLGQLFPGGVITCLAMAFVGAFAPLGYLRYRQSARTTAFNRQIADALILISNSLRAGHSFLQTMEVVARELPDPMSREFGRTLREMSLGVPIEDAFEALNRRIRSKDMELVTTAILIQRQVGGNLAEILDNIADTVRERVRIQGEIRTLTAQGRISGGVISLLPVGLAAIMSVLNPGYASILFTHPLGQLMLGVAVVGIVIGAVMIRRIVRIQV